MKKNIVGLPEYTNKEELANTITHIFGMLSAIAVLIIILIKAGSAISIVSGVIYSVSMLILYTASSVYHGLKKSNVKKTFRIIDHCTIYLLIAGTYTPILLSGVMKTRPVLAILLLSIEWVCAVTASIFNIINLEKYKTLSMICYIVMGWLIVVSFDAAITAMTLRGFLLLLFGGVSFTVGTLFYKIGKKKMFFHTVFHVFVVLGSVLQAISIINYII